MRRLTVLLTAKLELSIFGLHIIAEMMMQLLDLAYACIHIQTILGGEEDNGVRKVCAVIKDWWYILKGHISLLEIWLRSIYKFSSFSPWLRNAV